MKVVIFGATGMVGKGVLLECLEDARIERVPLVSRHPTDVSHPKIRESLHADFTEFESLKPTFADLDACFYCLGVTAVGLNEGQYHHLTYDLTLAAGTALASASAGRLTFCYVSGEGTDSTERGRTMWARVKGKTEERAAAPHLLIGSRRTLRSSSMNGYFAPAFYLVDGFHVSPPISVSLRSTHFRSASSAGQSACPQSVKLYSTFGGT